MSKATDIRNNILEAVNTIAMRRIDELKLDKTITAIIDSAVGVVNSRKVYKVEYEGGYFNAIAQNTNDAYLPRMAVYVSIPEGNFSNEKFIIGKASKIATDSQKSAIAAVANNYGIIGKNAIAHANDKSQFGLRSYHDPKSEIGENGTSIEHRYRFLYGGPEKKKDLTIDSLDLDNYKDEATAIMVKADFMTTLTEEQRNQASGEYGLVFNLVFKNLIATYGETYGEVFDYFADKLKVKDTNGNYVSLKDKDALITNNLTKGENNTLDIKLNEILGLIRDFKIASPAEYTQEMDEIVTAYTNELQNIINDTTSGTILNLLNSWKATKTGQSSEKTVSYFLSSNKMIGNPFYFSSWMSQYEVYEIDLENFLRVDSVLFYKDGFIENESFDEDRGEDIFVKDIQIYMMKPLTDYNGQYQLKVEATETGMTFKNENNPETIDVKASLMREFYEDLTNNADTTIYWFKQNESVVSASSNLYHVYGGLGWAVIKKENNVSLNYNNPTLTIKNKDTKDARENHYKCVAVYNGEETPIILRYDFIIYNETGSEFKIESDLGTSFGFDAGTPTLTVFIKNGEGEWEEIDASGETYKCYWSIIDENNQTLFLTEEISSGNPYATSVEDYLKIQNSNKLSDGVIFYDKNGNTVSDKKKASRIKYPMANIASDSKVTFEVYIGKKTTDDNFPSIGKVKIELSNKKLTASSQYRIYIENGSQVFQYSEYGYAPNSNKYKDQQIILPLTAHLFTPSDVEITSNNFRVKWYFPIEQSLIVYDSSLAKKNPANNKNHIFEGREIDFGIAENYDYNAIDNQIICQITYGDKVLEKDTNFFFGKIGDNGTNGTDVVAKIIPNFNNSILNEQPLTIYVNNINNNNSRKAFLNIQESSNIGADSINLANNGNTGTLIAKLYQKNQELSGYTVKWNLAGNVTSVNKGKYFTISSSNILQWNKNQISNIYRYQNIKAEITYDDKKYYAFYSLPIIEYTGLAPSLAKNRIAIKNDEYLKDVLYNADGRNPLYNHNQGLELVNIPKNCTNIVWEAKGGLNDSENSPCFKLLFDKDSKNGFIFDGSTKNTKVYVLPTDEYSGATCNNYIKATIKNGNNIIATVYAPINMTLNTFGLASLNAWDGNSVTIDDDGGYIMAPQIGAGEKDNNNRFTGILMGKTETYTGASNNAEETGLFGYSQGLQSIFLDAKTGNATFGLPSIEKRADGKTYYTNSNMSAPSDNYNEGRIELRPGGTSTIGGWRLGRQSLFYSSHNTGTKNSNNEWIYAVDDSLDSAYFIDGEGHQKDIPHESKGILLSAKEPYIYVKSRKIEAGDLTGDLSTSQINVGDSLGVQLDPQNYRAFGIYRHYYNTDDKKWTRVLLSGINNQGELVANKVQAAPAPNKPNATATTMGVNLMKAFEDINSSSSGPTYIGLNIATSKSQNIDIVGTSFFRTFIKNTTALNTNGTLYVTTGYNASGDYPRPLSVHAQTINLYASGNNTNLKDAQTTNHKITLDSSRFIAQAGSTNNQLDLNNSGISYLKTNQGLTINVGNASKSTLSVNSGATTITTAGTTKLDAGSNKFDIISGAQTITSGPYTLTSSGAVSLCSSNNDFSIYRRDSNNTGGWDSTSKIKLSEEQAYIRANNANTRLFLKNNDVSDLTVPNGLTIKNTTTNQISIIGHNGAPGYADLSESAQIILKSELGLASKTYSSYLGLGAISLAKNNEGYSFYVEGYRDDSGVRGGSIGIHNRNIGDHIKNTFVMNDMGLQVAKGINIQGDWLTNKYESAGYALKVQGKTDINEGVIIRGIYQDDEGLRVVKGIYGESFFHAKGNVSSGGDIYATEAKANGSTGTVYAKFFDGDGTNITNTCDGKENGDDYSISGVGTIVSFNFSRADITNGRPRFIQKSVWLQMPTADQIWNAIKEKLDNEYVTKDTYNAHRHNFPISDIITRAGEWPYVDHDGKKTVHDISVHTGTRSTDGPYS